jgi:hypothetical protein
MKILEQFVRPMALSLTLFKLKYYIIRISDPEEIELHDNHYTG